MVGVPARQVGWMSEYGEQIDLPIQGDGQWVCQQTGQHYILKAGQMSVGKHEQ
jgi:UDP-2-acetamido-3-amino-2,3-dideoxy-glucuronate N-acetyltransferase